MKGKKHSEETRKKFSEMRSGKPHTEEHKRKISEAQKGRHHTPANDFKKGNTINVGRHHSEETKAKMSRAATGRIKSPEECRKISESNRGKVCSEEHREKTRKALLGRIFSDEHRKKISDAKRENFKDPALCRKMGLAWGLKPNKPESLLLKFLESLYPGEWKYTGDFSMTINGKCPDFVNCNGQKKVIELFGDYWHEGEDPKGRAAKFSPFGYQTLVIWEKELKNLKGVAGRIRTFMEA